MASRDEYGTTYVMKCRVGLDGRWEKVPDRFCEMLDYPEKDLKELTFSEITHPDDREESLELSEKLRRGDLREFEMEKRYLKKSGEAVWVYINGALIKNDSGEPDYVVCYIHEITGRKQTQKKLEEREQQFRSLFKHNPDPVYLFDLEGNFIRLNDKLADFAGYSREELLKMSFIPFIHEKDLERTLDHFRKAASGQTRQYEITVIVQNGVEREIRVTNFPMYVGDEITGVYGILHDITEENHARRELKESEERWHRLVENNPQPVQVVQGRNIMFINKAGAELYGAKDPDELIGRDVFDFSHPDNRQQVEDRRQMLENMEEIEPNEQKIVDLQGNVHYIEAHSIPIHYKGEKAIQTVIHDITNRKEQENIIKKSLKEKETLLQEIHHRVKNNLAVISGLLELQAMNTEDISIIHALSDSQLRIHSMAMIHEKLYQSEALSDLGFDRYLEELVHTINDTYRNSQKNIETTFDLDSLSLNIDQAIPCSLIVNEVVVNCYKHAFSFRDSGKIEISMAFDEPDVAIRISDNGEGLPEDFDIEEQQSLGVTLIQTLVRQLGGEIQISSDEKSGTVVALKFQKD